MANPPDKKNTGMSFLAAAAAAAPLGFTGFHVGQRIRQHATNLIPKERATVAAVRHASNALKTISIPTMSQHLDWMQKLGGSQFFRSPQGGEIARQAFAQASNFSGARVSNEIQEIAAQIKDLPVEQVADALDHLIKTHDSSLFGPVLKKFTSNVSTLQKHYQIMGSVPKLAPAVYKGVAPTRVGLSSLPTAVQSYVNRWKESGLQFNQASVYNRPGHGSATVLHMQGPLGQRFQLRIPEVNNGVMRLGSSFQAAYIAPGASIVDKETKTIRSMSRPEYLMEEFEQSILPAITGGQLKSPADITRAIKSMSSEVLHKQQTVSPAGPEGFMPGEARYVNIRQQRTQLRMPNEVPKGIQPGIYRWRSAFRRPTEDEQSAAMLANNLKGGISPLNIKEGYAGTFDMAATYGSPQAADYSRRLEQFNRPYQLSTRARALGAKRYGRHDVLNTPEMKALYGQEGLPPQMRTLYVDPAKYGNILRQHGIGEGEIGYYGDPRVLEMERPGHYSLKDVDTNVLEAIQNGTADTLTPGQVIGTDIKTGKLLTVKDMSRQRILGISPESSEGKGEYWNMRVSNTDRMRQHFKVFRDFKGMVVRGGEQDKAALLKDLNVIDKGYEIIAYMDDARKNAALHNKQMVSALREVIGANFRKAGTTPIPGTYLHDIWANPVAYEREISALASSSGTYRHEDAVRQIMRTAVHQADVTPGQFGHIFGLAPTALGESTANSLAQEVLAGTSTGSFRTSGYRNKYIQSMNKGFASGRGQMFYGGPRQEAGVLGSIEPRFLEILSGSHFGSAGQSLKKELIERLIQTDPNKYATHSALVKSIASMIGMDAGAISDKQVYSAKNYSKAGFQKWIEDGGGTLQLGKGFGDIYVPGASTFGRMEPYKTAGGKTVRGDMANIYHQIASKGAGMYRETDATSAMEMQKVLAGSVQSLWKQAAPAGKKAGGYLRGQVEGSRYFTNVSKVGATTATELGFTTLPGYETAEGKRAGHVGKMLDEMVRSGQYTEEQAAERWKTLRSGGSIPGWTARHPSIGPFSVQPTRFRMANSKEAVIGLPEMLANVNVNGVMKSIPIGPNVGHAADKDADTIAAFMVSPKGEEEVTNLLRNQNNQYTTEYVQHQLRLGILKAKKGAGTTTSLTIEQKMVADTRKLGTTQNWIGPLSVNLTATKQKFAEHISNPNDLMDAMFASEYLEQNVAAAKHLSPESVASGKFATLMTRASSALQYGDAGEISSVFNGLIESKGVAEELMRGNVSINNAAELSQQLGMEMPNQIRGMNVERVSALMAGAIQKSQGSDSVRMGELLAGRGKSLGMGEAPGLIRKMMSNSRVSEGVFSKVATAAQTATNLLGSAGESMIKYSKPLAWTLAGSLAIATALSTPSDSIGPGANLENPHVSKRPGKAAGRMNAEDLIVDSPQMGSPSVPSMLHQNRTTIAPGANHVRVSATARGQFHPRNFSAGLSSVGMRSVNLNVRDNRNSSNIHLQANKLFR